MQRKCSTCVIKWRIRNTTLISNCSISLEFTSIRLKDEIYITCYHHSRCCFCIQRTIGFFNKKAGPVSNLKNLSFKILVFLFLQKIIKIKRIIWFFGLRSAITKLMYFYWYKYKPNQVWIIGSWNKILLWKWSKIPESIIRFWVWVLSSNKCHFDIYFFSNLHCLIFYLVDL